MDRRGDLVNKKNKHREGRTKGKRFSRVDRTILVLQVRGLESRRLWGVL